jgi:hypothetical protein
MKRKSIHASNLKTKFDSGVSLTTMTGFDLAKGSHQISRSITTGRRSNNYEEKRRPFTLTVYSIRIRCFKVYHDYRKK